MGFVLTPTTSRSFKARKAVLKTVPISSRKPHDITLLEVQCGLTTGNIGAAFVRLASVVDLLAAHNTEVTIKHQHEDDGGAALSSVRHDLTSVRSRGSALGWC